MITITNIQELLDAIEESIGKDQDISVGDLLDAVGSRSFGPLLLMGGLVMAAPGIGDIPGVPTGAGIFVGLLAIQMLFRRKYVWLPKWILDRTVSDEKACKLIGWVRRPARYVDRVVKPRLVWITNSTGAYAMAIACLVIALATPLMELVLFSANVAGTALAAFGLALAAHDGLVALAAFTLVAAAAGAILYALL